MHSEYQKDDFIFFPKPWKTPTSTDYDSDFSKSIELVLNLAMYPLRCSPRYCFHVCCHCYPDTFTKRLIFTPRTSRLINLLRYVKEKLHVWFLRPPTRSEEGVQRQSAMETVIYIFIWQPNRQISPSENHPIVSRATAAELHLFSAEILFHTIWFAFYLFRTTWAAFSLSFLSGSITTLVQRMMWYDRHLSLKYHDGNWLRLHVGRSMIPNNKVPFRLH